MDPFANHTASMDQSYTVTHPSNLPTLVDGTDIEDLCQERVPSTKS